MQSERNTTRAEAKIDFAAVKASKLAMFRQFQAAKERAEKSGAFILKSL